MRFADNLNMALGNLLANRLRTLLTLFAVSLGTGSVIILTGVGDGARNYVIEQFSSLGTNLVIVLPGRSETAGAKPSTFLGETPRDLTIADAVSLEKIRQVRRVAPIIVGEIPVSFKEKSREVPVIGSTSELLAIRHFKLKTGRFLPRRDPEKAYPILRDRGKGEKRTLRQRQPCGKACQRI